jgi:hypothetical protein
LLAASFAPRIRVFLSSRIYPAHICLEALSLIFYNAT